MDVYLSKELSSESGNKRNPHKDLPPFMVGHSLYRSTLLAVAAVWYFSCILASHSLTDTKTCYLTLRVPPVYALCTGLALPTDNAKITSPP
jgi:hypothetical protein